MPQAKKAAPKTGRVKAQYVEADLPQGDTLTLDYVGPAPTLTVLGVKQVEGAGMGKFVNKWRYVLTWSD